MKENIIIIPAYKPSEGLIDIVNQLKNYFTHIIVVNDGNGQEFSGIFDSLKQKGCIVLRHAVNLGKGRALKTAFNKALIIMEKETEIEWGGVVTADADGQHLIKDIINVSNALVKTDELILGCRQFEDRKVPLRSKFGNKITKLVFKWLCGLKISDTQTGLRGIPKELLGFCCKIEGERYEYETNMLLMMRNEGIKMNEVRIETVYENNNSSSHFNPLVDSLKIYRTIFGYSLSSIIAVLVDFVVFRLIVQTGGGLFTATYSGRAVSACFNFTLNRNMVFKSAGKILPQAIKYIILVIVSGAISGICLNILKQVLIYDVIILKVFVEVILYFFNYYIQNTLIFVKGNR